MEEPIMKEETVPWELEVKYFNVALNIGGLAVNERTAELILEIYEKVKQLRGAFSIDDAVKLRYELEMKWEREERAKMHEKKRTLENTQTEEVSNA